MISRQFIKDWLAASEEVKALFISEFSDDRQKWVCPECLESYGAKDKHWFCNCDGMITWTNQTELKKNWLQPIPRLDQLVRMVIGKWELAYYGGKKFTFFLLHYGSEKFLGDFNADTPEEAVLKGILWEHERG